MSKNRICLLLCLVLLSSDILLAGCGKTTSNEVDTDAPTTAATEKQTLNTLFSIGIPLTSEDGTSLEENQTENSEVANDLVGEPSGELTTSEQTELVETESEKETESSSQATEKSEQTEETSEQIVVEIPEETTTEVETTVETTAVVMTEAASVPANKNTSLEDELKELEAMDEEGITPTQRNAINMLNYVTELTQEINSSKESRVYLDTTYNFLIDYLQPSAVDSKTKEQINKMLNTLHKYQMIAVKRDRLKYIYEQNQAQALRKAIPNPVGLLSAVQSGNMLKAAASVVYMAVDAVSSYESATAQADLQYLKDGWELDDEASDEIHNSRLAAFNYMLGMVHANNIPDEMALNDESVGEFVKWKNKSNNASIIFWLESNEDTYKEFGPYWLELAKDYYKEAREKEEQKESRYEIKESYRKCLKAVDRYEAIATKIFRADKDYANILPMAILAAKEAKTHEKYTELAEKYLAAIIENTNKKDSSDWAIRYFAAQIYLDLYNGNRSRKDYLESAYRIVSENVNLLADEQKKLNDEYRKDVQEVKVESGATKQQKEDAKQYNKMLKESRKTALPPISEALYLNCDMLFALADEMGISKQQKDTIDKILHEDGNQIFLSDAIDNRFRFAKTGKTLQADDIKINFNGSELEIPANVISDKSQIIVTIAGSKGPKTITDWKVIAVDRPKTAKTAKTTETETAETTETAKTTETAETAKIADHSKFMVKLSSEEAKKYSYTAGETCTVSILQISEDPKSVIDIVYNIIPTKKAFVFNDIKFERQ